MAPFIAAGARLIAEALKEAHEKNVSEGKPDALEVVVFGRNRMESPGATHLAKALALYKDSLLHIQAPKEVGPDGLTIGGLFRLTAGIHVIKALTLGNTNLERIALFFNEINAKGAELVPGMLANKNALTSIELNGNVFDADSEAVQAIRDVLNRLGKEDALDELDEMEEEDEEEEEEEDEKDNESQDEEVDDLAAQLGKTKV
ncbi:Ran GTPase-activating protein 1 [Kappamyces sp. JEL0680]|nr:Ran GTPase-activating protein 1 [Kappamyces sp. JEL0680]